MPPYAYVTSGGGDNALIIVDTAQNGAAPPALVGVLRDASWIGSLGGLCVLGDFAYVCTQVADLLAIVDVSNPALPVLRGSIGGAGAPNFMDTPIHCHTRNNICYVISTTGDAVSIFDVSDPDNPTLLGSTGISPGAPLYLNQPSRIYVDAHLRAFVTSYADQRLTILDVSDPTNITSIGSVNPGFNGPRLVSGQSATHCYVLSFFIDELHVIDISDPTNPFESGSVNHAQIDGAFNGWLGYPYIYATGQGAGNGRFGIFDISDPTLPVYVGGRTDMRYESARGICAPIPGPGEYQKVFICGSNAVADSFCRLRIDPGVGPLLTVTYESWLQGSGPPNYMTSPSFCALAEAETAPASVGGINPAIMDALTP